MRLLNWLFGSARAGAEKKRTCSEGREVFSARQNQQKGEPEVQRAAVIIHPQMPRKEAIALRDLFQCVVASPASDEKRVSEARLLLARLEAILSNQ